MTERPEAAAHEAVERVARESYGRVLSYLCARTRDVAGAEDALSDALLAALTTWPRDGVPANPAAWLLTAARHALVDVFRHEKLARERQHELRILSEIGKPGEEPEIPDERLQLLFVCAHRAIDPGVRTPLMLQTVLGVDAARIAQAFMVPPATMGQRLVRAKMKIRKIGIPFVVPQEREMPERLEAVLEAIYAAYGIGWDDMPGADPLGRGLSGEAIWLSRVLVQLLPDHPEAQGLLALMLHCEARRPARRDADGSYVPLTEQDSRLWSSSLIAEAESLLATASHGGRPGR
ncbi:MAG: RNA polymerase sigma factor, partial [Terriglobales bacterium]